MSTQKRSCIVSHVWQLAEGTITIGRPSNPKSTPTYFYRFLKFKVTGRRIDDNAEEQGNNSNNIAFKHPRYQDGFCLSCACSDMDNLRENLHRDHLSFWGISQEDTLAVLEKIFKVQNDRGNGSIIVVILDVDVDMNIQYDHDTEAANNNDNILLDRNMIRESLEDTTQGAEVAELISKLKFGLQGLEEVSDVYRWEVLWKERKCPLCKKNLSVWWKKRERIVRLPCSHLYHKDCIEEQVMKAKNYGCRSCREREHMDLLLIWYGVIHRPYVIRKCYEQVFKFLWF